MRAMLVLSLCVLLSAVLAGCSGSSDTSSTPATSTHPVTTPPHPTGTGLPPSNSTVPNKPPVAVLKVTNGSNATRVVMAGGKLTFDGSGSSDPDGKLVNAAIQVVQANQTLSTGPVQSLYESGAWTPATFNLTFAGPALVIFNVLDDQGAVTTNVSKVYVDKAGALFNHSFSVDAQVGTLNTPSTCKGASGNSAAGGTLGGSNQLVDQQYFITDSVTIPANVTYVTGQVAAGSADIVFCNAASEALSNDGSTFTTTAGKAIPPGSSYFIGIYSTGPTPPASSNAVSVGYTLHFEPQPAK